MVDARMLIGRFAGVARVVTQLVEGLSKQDGIDVVALCGREIYPAWSDRPDIEVVTSSFDQSDRTACRRAVWEERNLPRILRQAHVDLFHATWNSGIPLRCPVPTVLTIHDLIPWREPAAHFATRRQRVCYWYAVRSSARRATLLTTVSEYVRHQVLSALPVPPARVRTIPNGVHTVAVEADNGANPPIEQVPTDDKAVAGGPAYMLYVGGFEKRKNLEAVFAAVQAYWARFDPALELRLTGHADGLSPDAARAYAPLRADPRIRFLGDPDDNELARQYSRARALLMLSRDEGFGLPALEAMAHGCPVVAASCASLPEVVGDAGLLVRPDSTDDVVSAMRAVTTDDERRAACIRRGRRRAATFQWVSTAARMRETYEEACGRHGQTVHNAQVLLDTLGQREPAAPGAPAGAPS
jgi:glycosyltransferase involved in cell wall biosynthesis